MIARHTLLAAVGSLLACTTAFAAAGDPDPSFGTSGVVITKVGDISEAYDLVRQPDGKLVIAGYVEEGSPRATQILLVRYLPDGTLDDAFGAGGIVRTDAVPGFSTRAKALQLQPDGKLLAVGFTSTFSYWDGAGDVLLVRYLEDGALDPDFGTGGIVVTDVAGFPDQGSEVLVESDGRIVIAGFSRTVDAPIEGPQDALLARYLGDGTLDPDFGAGGIATLDLGGRSERAYAVVRTAAGGYVIAGSAKDPIAPFSAPGTAILARFDDGGVLDPTFGTAGVVEIDLGLRTGITDMVQLADGDLLTRGSYTLDSISGKSFLARFDANGSLDAAVGGGDGIVDPAPHLVFGLGLAPDGKVLGAGSGFLWGHWQSLGVSRIHADGTIDATFGHGGRASVWPGAGTVNAGAFAAAAEPDGSFITAAGFATDGPYNEATNSEPRYIALVRVLGDGAACGTDGECAPCEHCVEGVCASGPRTQCERPWLGGAQIFYAGGVDVKPRIRLKWKRINSPAPDPTTDAVGLCMWWGDVPIYESRVAPGTGWKTSGNGGVLFKDRLRANFGIEKIKIGRSGIDVAAQGPNIRDNPNGFVDALLQPGDDDVPLHVQLNSDGGSCFASTYPQGTMVTKYPAHTRRGVGY